MIGYRRVSSYDQNLERQDLGTLDRVFEEKVSGSKATGRPQLGRMLDFVRAGDEVVVWSIDRLARDLRDLQALVSALTEKGVTVRFISEGLTFGPGESDALTRLQLQLMGAFADFERNIIRRRQAEGIAKAKARGVYARGQRIDRGKVRALRDEGPSTYAIATAMGISRMTVYRVLREAA